MKRLAVLLLLASCSYPTLDELYVEHSRCTLAEHDCQAIETQIRKREAIIARRKERQGPDCGHRVAVCIDGRCGCVDRWELWR